MRNVNTRSPIDSRAGKSAATAGLANRMLEMISMTIMGKATIWAELR